jgi:hypothetical protein
MSGITIPVSLLSSAMHPDFHPRFMIREDREGEGEGEGEADEETGLLASERNNDHGFPIEREEIERILGAPQLDRAMSINSGQRQELVGDGGLKAWGRGKLSVYDEGNCLMICDEDGEFVTVCDWIITDLKGNVSVRKIKKKA